MSKVGDGFKIGEDVYVIDFIETVSRVGKAGSSSLFPGDPGLVRLRFEPHYTQRTLGTLECDEFKPGDPITISYTRVEAWPPKNGAEQRPSMTLYLNVKVKKGEFYG